MGEFFAGRFEILEPIAEGGMGSVWTARDHKQGSVVAVKLLRQADAGSLMRFMREQGTRIAHEHVITPISWAGEDDKVLFSMPLVRGGAVDTLIGDYGQLTPVFTAEVLRQLLGALSAVHGAGVVHRDIKPANLLLDPTGTDLPHVWLTDFGVATPLDAPRLTHVNYVIGTPGYLAPELYAQADPHLTQDIYAAGMVGAQMLTGTRPGMEDRFDVFTQPEGCPDELWRALRLMASANPDSRPQTADAALALLEVPALAWRPQEEIEVFEHITAPAEVAPETGRNRVLTPTQPERPSEAAVQAAEVETRGVNLDSYARQQALGDRAADKPTPRTRRLSAAPIAGLAAFIGAALIGLAVVVAWHPWREDPPYPDAPAEPRTTDTHGPGAPEVNSECEWNMVGTETASEDDYVVRCMATEDGYRWRMLPMGEPSAS